MKCIRDFFLDIYISMLFFSMVFCLNIVFFVDERIFYSLIVVYYLWLKCDFGLWLFWVVVLDDDRCKNN